MEATIIKGEWAKDPVTLTVYMTEKDLRDLRMAFQVINNQHRLLKGLSVMELCKFQEFKNALSKADK